MAWLQERRRAEYTDPPKRRKVLEYGKDDEWIVRCMLSKNYEATMRVAC